MDPLSTLLEQQKKIHSLNQAYHCIASETNQISTLHGPLQGVGMIHKDIFQLEEHMPGLGVNAGYAQAKVTRARAITKLHEAGASIVVIGNHIETHPDFLMEIKEYKKV